ncbi:hypothetical protein Shyhy01_33660 [Streptomyces hygroscopicus subsp. hygroscopicus]|nr:hypothetical protein Shyhy01_33660 [Streptomyces hygroscopicus subsp. hygroscopicus]
MWSATALRAPVMAPTHMAGWDRDRKGEEHPVLPATWRAAGRRTERAPVGKETAWTK